MNGSHASPLSIQITLSLGKRSGSAVQHPVGHVHHVVPDEAERMDRDELVHQRHGVFVPVVAGVERERQAGFLDQRVGLHVVVVVHRVVAHRRDHEADHALLAGELLDHPVAGVRIVERQIEHRADARLLAPARARRASGCRRAPAPPRPRPADAGRAAASARETAPRCRRPWRPSSAASARRRGARPARASRCGAADSAWRGRPCPDSRRRRASRRRPWRCPSSPSGRAA